MAFTVGVYYRDRYWQLPLEVNSNVTIGASKNDTLTTGDSELRDAHLSFVWKKDGCSLISKPGVFSNGTLVHEAKVSDGEVFTSGHTSIYICAQQADYERTVILSANREFLFGRSKECVFCLSNKRVSSRHAKITFESGRYKLVDLDSKNHTFVNGIRVSTHYLCDGDVISIAQYSSVFENGELSFLNTGNDLTVTIDNKDIARRYPLFRRSPRLGNAFDAAAIQIQQPPHTGEKPRVNWLTVLLPPLVMIAISIISMVLSGGELATLLFILPMSLVTLLTTIASYFGQVRKFRSQQKMKIRGYNDYIEQKTAELELAYNRQFDAANNANPETSYCYDIVSNRMRRLWERSSSDDDFLNLRLGRGNLPLSTAIVLPQLTVGEEINPQLLKLLSTAEQYKTVRDIAVTLPVRSARTIGMVGARQVAARAIQNSIVQLTTHHSYSDVNIIIVSSEKDYEQWSWTRWLPHTWDNGRKLRYLSSDKKQAAELLGYFEEGLKKRAEVLRDGQFHGQLMLPYWVFVITDYTLVESREFLKLIATAGDSVGASAILLFDSISRLPKECDLIVEFNNQGGTQYSRADSASRTAFVLDAFDDYEKFARAMAPIRDRNATQSTQLPASVTFYQGFGIRNATDINLLQNWSSARPHKSLAVPIGTKENGKPFLFDLHEKAHGPHGLAAGTTGSGKSEVLQTWILSMCASFSPQDVSFIIIDFKGLGLAGTLKALPHTAGVISNVDENIQRNLFSLESELSRRQRLFADVSTDTMKIGDIYDYQDAFMQGKLSEALSHLIVVVDEFTELKTKFPEFMSAVDRAARVGRSLGVHLLLATQKPDGAVTDEMRANSNFKWCLRMANDMESKSVLGRAEAASIAKEYPGRAYFQIGNNEIFELVQTYYSGASVSNQTDEDAPIKVSFVDSLGRREIVSQSSRDAGVEQEKELLALVRHIVETHRASGLPRARRVWEDSLVKRLYLPEIKPRKLDSSLYAVIGITDDPRHQCQYPTEIDFAADGHIIIYGAPGTGKTVLLQTIVMSLAERYTPSEVSVYIMDFGSWSMGNLQSLPHVGGVANGNEHEKVTNLVKLLDSTLSTRKSLFAQIGASNLDTYRQATGAVMPAIVVAVDNFAPIRELYPDVESFFVKLSREGSSYGIYIVITATSLSGNIGYNLSQNFKQALSLRMTDKADYRDIVGDTEGLEPSKVAGRGLVRGKPPMEFQTALAVEGSDDVEYVALLKAHCRQLADEWQGDLPREIPVMPDIVLNSHVKADMVFGMAIGLSADDIEPVYLSPDNRVVIISGTEGSGKTNLLRVIATQSRNRDAMHVVSCNNNDDAAAEISAALKKAADGEPVTLIIDDITSWLTRSSYDDTDVLEALIASNRTNGFSIYASANAAELSSSGHSVARSMATNGTAILLGGCFRDHYSQFEASNLGYSQQSEQIRPYHGYLIQRRKATEFKALFAGGIENGI